MMTIQIIFTRIRMAILIVCLLVSAVSWAEMYKWKDEEGNTVYSELPPSGDIDAEVITPPAKVDTERALMNLRNEKIRSEKLLRQRQTKKEDQQQVAEAKARKEENCRRAQARLRSFATRPTVQLEQADGSNVRATEEQRQEQIAGEKFTDLIGLLHVFGQHTCRDVIKEIHRQFQHVPVAAGAI